MNMWIQRVVVPLALAANGFGQVHLDRVALHENLTHGSSVLWTD